MANGWFDNKGFNTYYLSKSKYASKQKLLDDFYRVWIDCYGCRLTCMPDITYKLKKAFTADLKKRMKVLLIGKGYTSAGIDGIFKAFGEWIKSAPL
ncbi:MAG: hypothetical protein IJB96_09260 [Lachnospira sp.]|nr:hypothetical protein [Lachnospira sp.]